jgi:prepilin-type N-terminal cleavage/methylation domain-containing protein
MVKSQKGFTLIEVLAAVVILSVAALLLYTVFSNAALLSLRQQNQDVSLNVARMVMEEVRSNINCSSCDPYEPLDLNPAGASTQSINLAALQSNDTQTLFFPSADNHEYSVVIESADPPSAGIEVTGQDENSYTFDIDSNYRLIRVQITALNPDGTPKSSSTTLESYVNIGGAP